MRFVRFHHGHSVVAGVFSQGLVYSLADTPWSEMKAVLASPERALEAARAMPGKSGGVPVETLRLAAPVDANQKWGVEEAIERTRSLRELDLWWMEEPTSPDDVLGHARIRRETGVRIATGEHCQNQVMFKQLLQAEAIDVCQIDSCRVAGVNENLAIILMAAKFGVPVCPHAGGVGLCEYVQHLAAFDFLCASSTLEDRVVEYVDHLHEHFVTPVRIRNGRYMLPETPGYSIEIKPGSLAEYTFPDGTYWRSHVSGQEELAAVVSTGGRA